jgi:hypothetical protein
VKVVHGFWATRPRWLTLDRYGHLFPDDLDAVATAFDAAAQTTAGALRAIGNLKVVAADGITV